LKISAPPSSLGGFQESDTDFSVVVVISGASGLPGLSVISKAD
jgi:hypothetical protein